MNESGSVNQFNSHIGLLLFAFESLLVIGRLGVVQIHRAISPVGAFHTGKIDQAIKNEIKKAKTVRFIMMIV